MTGKINDDKCSLDSLIFISAMCLFLSAIEYAIPKPLPFLRLGLANLPVIIFLKRIRFKDLLLIIVFKVLGQAIISGTLFSYIFIFSVSGSFASGLMMFAFYKLLYRKKIISNVGLSLFGAMANCSAQLICAYFIMFGANTIYIAPLLTVFSVITGVILGLFCNYFEQKSKWLQKIDLKSIKSSEILEIPAEIGKNRNNIIAIFTIIIAIIFLILLLSIRNNICTWSIVGLFFILLEIKKKGKVKLLPPFLTVFFIILFSLLSPYGLVYLDMGLIKITQGALESGLRKSGILIGMTFCSQLILASKVSFHGKIGVRIQEFFNYYGMFSQSMRKIKFKGIIQFIDEHLQNITDCSMAEGGQK
ncbi:MAG: Gx transporter family protein [Treponema sp.]|nr:Gx transporter family protein [Treponema sp.]